MSINDLYLFACLQITEANTGGVSILSIAYASGITLSEGVWSVLAVPLTIFLLPGANAKSFAFFNDAGPTRERKSSLAASVARAWLPLD